MTLKEFLKSVGGRIKDLRITKNMSRELLGSQSGDISPDSIGNYERGDSPMSIATLWAIAKVLDMDPGSLVSDKRSTMLWMYERLTPENQDTVKKVITACYSTQRHVQCPDME